jgi:hypothetical protein
MTPSADSVSAVSGARSTVSRVQNVMFWLALSAALRPHRGMSLQPQVGCPMRSVKSDQRDESSRYVINVEPNCSAERSDLVPRDERVYRKFLAGMRQLIEGPRAGMPPGFD